MKRFTCDVCNIAVENITKLHELREEYKQKGEFEHLCPLCFRQISELISKVNQITFDVKKSWVKLLLKSMKERLWTA